MLLQYLFLLFLILFGGASSYSMPDNECNACISRNTNIKDRVEFSTPPDEEIIFNKIIGKDTVYRVQFMLHCVDFSLNDSSVYLDLTNNRQIGRPRVPIGVKMTKSMKKPFILTAAFDLNWQEIIILKNFGITSFSIGQQEYPVENKKQKTFMHYFKCLISADIEKIKMTDIVAEDVNKTVKETGYDFSGVQKPANTGELHADRYADYMMSLVKAVQELQSEVKRLRSEINSLKSDLKQSAVNNPLPKESYGQPAILFQNSSSRFNSETEIKFQLPAKFNSAMLIISDESGKQIRTYNVQLANSIVIRPGEFSAGKYSYALIIDGITVDSKQMVFTK